MFERCLGFTSKVCRIDLSHMNQPFSVASGAERP